MKDLRPRADGAELYVLGVKTKDLRLDVRWPVILRFRDSVGIEISESPMPNAADISLT